MVRHITGFTMSKGISTCIWIRWGMPPGWYGMSRGAVFSRLTRYIFGQITGRTDPAGHRPGFRYDRFGRLKALVNEKEESYRFEYDALHRLTREKSRLFLRLTLIKNYFKIHNYFDK